VTPVALFLWGALLGLAPITAGYVAFSDGYGVWTTSVAAALAACGVVALFGVSVTRKL
jgi:hypothetical protein